MCNFNVTLARAAAHDAGVAVWRAKYKYDAVRPFSAIGSLYRGKQVSAYGGPATGGVTVDDLPGEEWQSYATRHATLFASIHLCPQNSNKYYLFF